MSVAPQPLMIMFQLMRDRTSSLSESLAVFIYFDDCDWLGVCRCSDHERVSH